MPAADQVDLLQAALAQLCQALDGARGAGIVTTEGFVVASYPLGDQLFLGEGDASRPQVAAMASTLTALAERMMACLGLGQGDIPRLLIEGSQGTLALVPISNEVALVVVLDREAKAGVAMALARRAAQQVRPVLEGVAGMP